MQPSKNFQTVADHVDDDLIERGTIYPPLRAIKECSIQIATKITQYAYSKGIT